MTNDPPARLLDSTVGALAAEDLRACARLDQLGLSFATDADLHVAEACRQRHADASSLMADLTPAVPPPPQRDWWALDESCRLVVDRHHGPLRAAVANLRTTMAALCGRSDRADPVLDELRRRLEAVSERLLVHFAKEEHILFPALAALAEAHRRGLPPPSLPFATVLHPIRAMEVEHDALAREFGALLSQAQGVAVVPDADDTDIQRRLQTLAGDLAAHTRFETGLLFRRALELERTLVCA
jgi:iron-sulfur cluster repair protein YtfE (RIC family)